MLKGLTWQSLKANYSLIPLFSVVTLGMVMAAGHSFRCLAFSSDVKVNRHSAEFPWEAEHTEAVQKRAKYLALNDYRKIKKNDYAPSLDE